MTRLADEVRGLAFLHVAEQDLQESLSLASDIETLEARLQLVKDLALTARNAAPEGKEPYWVSPILQAIGES